VPFSHIFFKNILRCTHAPSPQLIARLGTIMRGVEWPLKTMQSFFGCPLPWSIVLIRTSWQGVTDSAWFWASKQGSAQQMGEALKIVKQQNSLLKVKHLGRSPCEIFYPLRFDFTPILFHGRCNLRQRDSSS
jgi:hypothetical protein